MFEVVGCGPTSYCLLLTIIPFRWKKEKMKAALAKSKQSPLSKSMTNDQFKLKMQLQAKKGLRKLPNCPIKLLWSCPKDCIFVFSLIQGASAHPSFAQLIIFQNQSCADYMKISLRIVGAIILAFGCALLAYAFYRTSALPSFASKVVNVNSMDIISLVLIITGYWLIVRKMKQNLKQQEDAYKTHLIPCLTHAGYITALLMRAICFHDYRSRKWK